MANIDLVKLLVAKVSLKTMSGGGQMIPGSICRLGILIDLRAVFLNRGQFCPLPVPFYHPCKGIFGNVWKGFWLPVIGAGELLASSG